MLTLYVDGAAVATGQGGTQALISAPGLRIGCLQSGVNFVTGTGQGNQSKLPSRQ